MSVVWCCSQSASQPNHCPIHVSHIVSLAVLSDLRQPHSVARSAARSMSVAWCCSQSASQPNRCPIHVTYVVVRKVCPVNIRTRARMKARMRARNEGGNEGENEGGEGMQPNQNKVTYIIEFDWWKTYSMSTFHAQWTWFVRMIIIPAHKCDWRNFHLFLGTGGGRCLCSMADSCWLSAINRSTRLRRIAPLQIA